MGRESGRLDYWRKYFSGCNSDIFAVIENAILVAASDCPKEFLTRRDGIAEKLFSCRSARCVGCDRVELQVPCGKDDEGEEVGRGRDGRGQKVGGEEDGDRLNGGRMVSTYSYDEAEALTEEIEEEGQTVGEVLRIKELLTNNEYKSESVLFESLRRLQLMGLSVETLKATEIGKTVNGLRKHVSKQIRQLARTLIEGWKAMVEEWANSTAVLSEATPESANPPPTFDEWDGLPLPPFDEGALFATQTGTMELSQFFEGMDDDGNFRSSGEFDAAVNTRKISLAETSQNRTRKPHSYEPKDADDKHPMRMYETLNNRTSHSNVQDKSRGPIHAAVYQHKQSNVEGTGTGLETIRPPKPSNDQRAVRDTGIQNRPPEVQQKPPAVLNDKACAEDRSVREKLEISKRKLHEGYRQAETAKRQRTIQVMELQDLPKQGLDNRQLHQKPINGNRHWTNRRV